MRLKGSTNGHAASAINSYQSKAFVSQTGMKINLHAILFQKQYMCMAWHMNRVRREFI